ncbi:DUF6447 family protein [Synechococcus sp. UW140]|uniref:DUF6447 family protein n=1 Tax=Synechococcus sp. UW140 TaxID=368503 RepID=UPI000E0EE1B5|nr:DUF6447 family protein [Synechococcus sp. UW140]
MFKKLKERFWSKSRQPGPGADSVDAHAGTAQPDARPQKTAENVITVDGRRYDAADISEDLSQMITDLMKADRALRRHSDKVQILRLGRRQMEQQLRQGLSSL